MQKQFFNAVGNFLRCRIHEMDDDHKDQLGALMGSLDWYVEARLILKEWSSECQKESSKGLKLILRNFVKV